MKKLDSNQLLNQANKLIFVKDYSKAQEIIEKLIHDTSFDRNLMIHLRRIELGAKLGLIDDISKDYQHQATENPQQLEFQICQLLTE